MKRSLAAGLAGIAIVAAASATLAQAADAGPQPPPVPTEVQVEEGHKVFLVGHATGVQIYQCNGAAWGLLAPRADLVDDSGNVIVTHFGGPTWEAKDGSSVVGQRVDGITVDPTAIPWLLLSVKNRTAGPDGDRLMSTRFIQRTDTTGGLAPAPETCDGSRAGHVVEVPYTADYYFWKKAG